MAEDTFSFTLRIEDMPMNVRRDLETDLLAQRFIPTHNSQIVLEQAVSATIRCLWSTRSL
jgi:hypothetical protein